MKIGNTMHNRNCGDETETGLRNWSQAYICNNDFGLSLTLLRFISLKLNTRIMLNSAPGREEHSSMIQQHKDISVLTYQ